MSKKECAFCHKNIYTMKLFAVNVPPFTTSRRIKEFTDPAFRCHKCGKYYCIKCGPSSANNICNKCFHALSATQQITKRKDDKDNLNCLCIFVIICISAFLIFIINRGIFEMGFLGFVIGIVIIIILVGLIFLTYVFVKFT